MRNISDKICRENQNTLFVFNNFLPKQTYVFYTIIWRKHVSDGQATDAKYGARVFYARQLRLQTYTQNM